MRSILKHLFTTALLPCAIATFAQPTVDKVKVKVRISTDSEADARMMPYSIIPSDGNSIMMMRSGEFDVRAFGKVTARLDLYDRDKLTFIRSQEPVMKRAGQEKLRLEDLVLFGGRPMLIARYDDETEVAVYWQPVDPNLTKPPPVFERICAFPVELHQGTPVIVSAGSALRSPFRTFISRDSTHMLICSPEVRDDDDGGAMYLMVMVDRDMKVEWQQILRVSDKANRSRMLDVEVDTIGNAYLMVRNEFGRRDFVDGKANFELKLFVAGVGGIEETSIDLGEGLHASQALLKTLEHGRLVCAGVYRSSVEDRWEDKGNFVSMFEAGSVTMGQPRLMEFNAASELNENAESDEAEGSKQEAKDKARTERGTSVVDILPRSDGGFFLVNEVFYVDPVYDATAKRWEDTYLHGPVLVRAIDGGGKEVWSTFFRRWLRSRTTIMGQVFCAEFADQLFLFLLDSEEMAERRKEGKKISPKHIRGPYSAYVAFDDRGEYKIKRVLRTESNQDYIGGWRLVRTGKAEYIALGTEKLVSGKFLPVKIEFTLETKK